MAALPAADAAAELALANRILVDRGVLDAYGHVSVRHPERAEAFLLARNLAPARVTRDDVMAFDLDGVALDGDDRTPYLERHIHAGIYRARPDVGAVVHSHAPALIPFGVVATARLRPVCHMSGFLAPRVPVFEIRDAAGAASDLLVRDAALGRALAQCLDAAAVVLMRGHGVTTVGASLRQAVFRSVYAELNARLQLQAQALGEPTFLNDAEAARSAASNDGQIDRAWAVWVSPWAEAHAGSSRATPT